MALTHNEISMEKVFLALRAHSKLIISFFITAVVIAGIITYLSPKMYLATTSLNFEFSANPVDTRGNVLSQKTYIDTQIDIIESQSVAQEVVNSLTEYEKARLEAALGERYSAIDKFISKVRSSVKSLFSDRKSSSSSRNSSDGTGGGETLNIRSAYSALARAIGVDLIVEPMIESRIVTISYKSTDRKIAALMANRYAEAYIATSVRMITDPAQKSKVWFDEQLKSLRTRLEEAQAELTAYQQNEGIVSTEEGRLNIESAHLEDLTAQLATAQQTTRNAVSEQRKLQEVIDSGASLMTFRPVSDNPVVKNIKAEIRSLKGDIAEKSSSLGKNHPDMKKLNSELYSAQRRLDSEIDEIIIGIANAADLSREREQGLEEALKSQKDIVLDLKNQHDQIAVIKREVESAQATYNAALNQLNTTSMQSMIDQTNVSIIDGANIPTIHATPRVMLNLALGAFGGLLMGIGLVLFMELIIRRVHTREELIDELNIPLLGHLKNA
ncbi:MAG: GNVR domain-containing protein [Nitrosomonadaceae bacterium]